MMAITESDGVIQVPTDRLVSARKDVRALKSSCGTADKTLAVPGSYDLAEEFVQAGNADFQCFIT